MNDKIGIQQIGDTENETLTADGFLAEYHAQSGGTYFPPHFHDHFELEIIEEGSLLLDYNNRRFTVESGSAYICAYNDIHALNAVTDAKIVNIRFSETLLDSSLSTSLLTSAFLPVCFFGEKEFSYIRLLAQKLFSEKKDKSAFYEIRAKNLISELVIEILRKSGGSLRPQPSGIQKAVKIMLTEFKNDLSLTELSARVHLSPDYFGKLFKSRTNLSFNEYLNLLRIRHACKLLINSDLSAKEIAFACGFNSQEYFMRSFKKINGETTGEYRRRRGFSF